MRSTRGGLLVLSVLLAVFLVSVSGETQTPSVTLGGLFLVPIADVTVTNAAGGVIVGSLNVANRVALICTNTSATVHVRVGGTNTVPTATQGFQFRATTTATITAREQIKMISEGANVTLACSEERTS